MCPQVEDRTYHIAGDPKLRCAAQQNGTPIGRSGIKGGTFDCQLSARLVRFSPILLQKSKVAGLEIFRENTTRDLIAD
jgi:hypothetical protein